jgi:hypothetical protein
MGTAEHLDTHLPGTKAALLDGTLSLGKTRIIAAATALLDPDEARAAEQEVLDRAARLTPPGLRAGSMHWQPDSEAANGVEESPTFPMTEASPSKPTTNTAMRSGRARPSSRPHKMCLMPRTPLCAGWQRIITAGIISRTCAGSSARVMISCPSTGGWSLMSTAVAEALASPVRST